jgi:hypothetical protein
MGENHMAITPILRTAMGEKGATGTLNNRHQEAPVKSGSGSSQKGWATPAKSRGHAASGRKLKHTFESTYGSKTKLASLKR